MALKNRSLFLYGIQITELNSSLDFRITSTEAPRLATLRLGFYSLTSLGNEIARAMGAVDPSNRYYVSADRSVANGLQNRVTIRSSGTHLDLLFGSGPRLASSVASLIGFSNSDYLGSVFYTGASSAGTPLVPELSGYGYVSPAQKQKVFGSTTISASGDKEAVVFSVQTFFEVEFKYEPYAKMLTQWQPFFQWCIRQRLIEFIPDVLQPNYVYEGTLESTAEDGKGMGFKMTEQLSENLPFFYTTGVLTFRVRSAPNAYI